MQSVDGGHPSAEFGGEDHMREEEEAMWDEEKVCGLIQVSRGLVMIVNG
jgi:hypothetical protein